MSSNKAWVTLATNDSYSLGALVLAHSLKTVNTAHKLAILITPGVTDSMKKQIEGVFDDVKVVDVLDSKDQTHLALMCRPELGVTFTKLHCWTLTKYEKCVFLDADTLVLQNCDELFERDELSAAPDPGWPDCFNSGVFVYKPSEDTFNKLLEFARAKGSFDGGDQGLLNMFFKEWAHKDISKHLSFTYNVVWSSTYSYLPALKQFGQNMKIIHFIASSKPWLQSFNTETRLVTATSGGTGLQALLQLWWDLFCHHVHPNLSTEMIESRLSSRYSNDSQSKIFQNNMPDYYIPDSYTSVNNNSKNYYAPTYNPPKEDHYTFIDPWEEYLVTNDQGNYNVEREKTFMCQNENVRGDSMVDVRMVNDQNKPEVENNDCKNNCHMEDQIRDYSFQNLIMENVNTSGDEEQKDEHFEEVREFHESKQEHYQINNKNGPACSDANPINLNSSLSVNNCRPDSPTNCEVPKDQICDLNGGLAGQFARVSLGEKTTDQKALEDFLRRQSWEHGNMDYLGKDSFSNIWAKINETLGNTSEVQIESSAVKTPSPPEVVHIEKPKPLKSALKKSSTTIPPVESELVSSSDPSVKQLEKLDLSKEVSKEQTPDTPTVTSPTPPTTPATQTKDSPKPESIREAPKSDVCAKESLDSVEQETPKLEATEPQKETPKPDVCSSVSSETPEQILPETDISVSKVEEPLKEISQTTDTTVQEPQSSVDNSTQLISDAPPVAPKRSNKGAPKPTEKK